MMSSVAVVLAVAAMGFSMIAIAMVSILTVASGVTVTLALAVALTVTLLAMVSMCGSLVDHAFGHSYVLSGFVLLSSRLEGFGFFEERPCLFAKLIRVLCDGRAERRRTKCHDHGQNKAGQRDCGNSAVHLNLSPWLNRSSNRGPAPIYHHSSLITHNLFFVSWCAWSLHVSSSHGSTLPNR